MAKTKISKKMKETVIDGVKISAVSGVLAYFGLNKSCSELPQEIGLGLTDVSGLQTALMAFDVGAGAFAGNRERYGASLFIYGATLIPEINEFFIGGDLLEAGKKVLAKTIVYGASYGLGYFFR